jgi:hypothetical protein
MPTPFETHPTWQSENPGLARRDREQHHRRIAEMGPGPEQRPGLRDVAAYFRETERGHLLQSDPTRSRYAHEKALIDDLEFAQFGDDPDETTDKLRRLIWAYSKAHEYPEQSLKSAVKVAEEIYADIRDEPVEKRGESSAEITEAENARDTRADRIEELGQAIKINATGEALQDLLPEIEYVFSSALKQAQIALESRRKTRSQTETGLAKLRILRDAAYQSYLFPISTEVIHRSEFGRERKPKKRVA